MEKQSFAGLIGAGAGGVIGAANLPDDATPQERARYAARGAIRGGGIGSGMSAGIALGELGRRMALKGQAKPSMTRQVMATLLPMLGGGLGSYAGYEIADEFARNPALGTDDEANAGDKAKADKREERMEKEKQAAGTLIEGPNGETFTIPASETTTVPSPKNNSFTSPAGGSVTDKDLAGMDFTGLSIPGKTTKPHTMSSPSAWDYLKNPLKNLATGGSYAKEQGMSRLYDENYYPHTLKGPKPAAGNSIRKAIAPMENNPMGGYSTPTQGVLTPYPRNKQGADGILSGLLGPSEAEKAKAVEEAKLEKAVARNVRERLARRIAKEKMAEDAAGIAYLSTVLEKEAKRGLWDNVHAKRKRGEKPAKKGDKDYPDEKSWKKTTKQANLTALRAMLQGGKSLGRKASGLASGAKKAVPSADPDWDKFLSVIHDPVGMKNHLADYHKKNPFPFDPVKNYKSTEELTADISKAIGKPFKPWSWAKQGSDKEAALKSLVLEKIAKSPAWQRKAGKNSEGGLNAKGRASYNKSTGGNLKAPVTSKKPKGKAKKRKASFCARMSGMKKKNTSKSTANDPDSRINKSLRKWNC